MYEDGVGVAQNDYEAIRQYKRSIDLGAGDNGKTAMAELQSKRVAESADPAQPKYRFEPVACSSKVEPDEANDFMAMLDSSGAIEQPPPLGRHTAFRGIQLGAEQTQLEKSVPQGILVKDCRFMRQDTACGSYQVGADNRVVLLRLYDCFFGASGLTLQDFGQQIVDNYPIKNLSGRTKNFGNRIYECYSGLSDLHEAVDVCEFPAVVGLGEIVPTIGIRIAVPASSAPPSFD
jgi:hypothetical protein